MNLGNRAEARRWLAIFAAILLAAFCCQAAAAQKNKKDKSKPDAKDDASGLPAVQGSDAEQIDHAIGEMLAAFQLGDVDKMHQYYADNVTFVSGAWEPPIVGWQNYVPSYQRQSAAFKGIQLVRRNTIIFPHGDVAWAMYQWEFMALWNGNPYQLRGQTTLIFNKIGGNWLIVHNHTSEVPSSAGQAPATTAAPAPAAKP